jgi:hypothetical protein
MQDSAHGRGINRRDYFVAITRSGSAWSWQIGRRSRPLGVKVVGGSYRTEQAAKLAGERALRDFLERLTQEDKQR